MSLDNRFSWRLEQSGRVSVTHQRLPGMVKNQVHIQCDCQSNSLLSDIVSAERQVDVRPVAATWLNEQLGKDAKAAAATSLDGALSSAAKAKADGRGGKKQKEKEEKTLVVRLKSAELKNNELLLTEGELTLQGEDVFVRDGVPFFQSKSQLTAQPSVGRPIVTGSQVDRKRLEAKNGQRNLYFGNSELLDGQRPIIQNPLLFFGSDAVPMETAARRRSLARSIEADELKKILPNHDKLGAIEAERSRVAKLGQETMDKGKELNKVVLVNGRCVLKDNCIVILRGLLHVGDAWHRIINSVLVGSDASNSPHPVTITGRPVYKDASACNQMLLNRVTLYSLGNTVYAGNAPLLEDAVLHADGQVINVSGLHLSSLCGLPIPKEPEPARLFVQGGRLSVQDTGLNIHDGTVWLQDVRMQLPEDSTEEVRVTDSLVFIGPACVSQDAGANKEVRDIIYTKNMLLLDDLTPLLKGGFVCHGKERQPLAWLSGDPDAIARARSSQMLVVPPEELSNRVQMLTDATCIVDPNGMYFIEGNMILQGKKVLIDRGVPLFSSETAEEIRKMNLGTPPPRLSGRVLLDPDAARQLDAKTMDGFFVLKNVYLDMTDGKIILNNRMPVMSDCKLVMDRHTLSPMKLGFDAGAREANAKAAAVAKETANAAKVAGTAAAAKAAVATKAGEDSAIAKNSMAKSRDSRESAAAISQAGSADDTSASPNKPRPAQPASAQRSDAAGVPEKTVISFAGTSTADQEDSGRGTSDWAESSQRAATALGSVAEAPAKIFGATGIANSKVADAAASDRVGRRTEGKSAGEASAGGSEKMAAAEPELEKGSNRELEEKTGGKSGGLSDGESRRESGGESRKESGGESRRESDGESRRESGGESGRESDGELRRESDGELRRDSGGESRRESDGELPSESDGELRRDSGGEPRRESGGASAGAPEKRTGEESGHDSDGESNKEPLEDPNRLSQKSFLSGKNIGIELGRDYAFTPSRDSTADLGGRDSVAEPRRESVEDSGKDSGSESKREADDKGVRSRHEREVPASTTARPLGDASSNGILGNFSVSSSGEDRKLVFSLKARIDEMLHFLDLQS